MMGFHLAFVAKLDSTKPPSRRISTSRCVRLYAEDYMLDCEHGRLMNPPPLAPAGKAEIYRANLPTKATSTALFADDDVGRSENRPVSSQYHNLRLSPKSPMELVGNQESKRGSMSYVRSQEERTTRPRTIAVLPLSAASRRECSWRLHPDVRK
jgi:hypothetical protein